MKISPKSLRSELIVEEENIASGEKKYIRKLAESYV